MTSGYRPILCQVPITARMLGILAVDGFYRFYFYSVSQIYGYVDLFVMTSGYRPILCQVPITARKFGTTGRGWLLSPLF
jgi:hypothetical protein